MRALFTAALIWAAIPTFVQAQGTERARQLFEQGVEALDDGRFRDAADLLRQSLEIRESAAARFNRALALRGAGDYLEALRELERTLELANTRRHRQLRQQAQQMQSELREQVATVRIHVEGGAERVEIDGEVVARADGLVELQRNPGPIVIVVRREGYAAVERQFEIAAGSERDLHLDASESAQPAHVLIVADPPEAVLRWQGQEVGTGRAQFDVPVNDNDTFHIEVSADDYEPQERTVRLQPGEEARLDFSLSEIPRTPLQRKWWFWTLIVIGAGAVAAGVGIAVRPDQQPIELGDLGFSQQVLRAR